MLKIMKKEINTIKTDNKIHISSQCVDFKKAMGTAISGIIYDNDIMYNYSNKILISDINANGDYNLKRKRINCIMIIEDINE